MSFFTHEILSNLDEKTLRVLSKDSNHKTVVLDFLAMREIALNADAIEASNKVESGALFTLNGVEVPFWMVAHVAKSSLSLDNDNAYNNEKQFPQLARVKKEADAIMKLVQRGFKAQGKEFGLRSESLRETVEALV